MTELPPVNHDLDLVLDRYADVPPHLVWRAWTEPEELKPWFCPKPWQTTHCEIDLRAGGRFRTVMEGPAGEKHDNTGCILEVVPDKKLVWSGIMGPDFRPANVPPGVPAFTAALTITPEGKGTRYHVHVMHRDAEERKAHEAMGFQGGWGTALDQMVAYWKAKA